MSGVDGRYLTIRVPAGTATIQVRRIGYGPKTVPGVIVLADGSVEPDVATFRCRAVDEAARITSIVQKALLAASSVKTQNVMLIAKDNVTHRT